MHADKQEVLKRFLSVEGHLEAIRKMLEEDQPCRDVLYQMYAVRKAIEKLEATILEHHFSTCIREGIGSERNEAVIAELVQIYRLIGNR